MPESDSHAGAIDVAQTDFIPRRLTRLASDLAPRGAALVGLALTVCVLGILGPPGMTELAALCAAATLAVLAAMLRLLAVRERGSLRAVGEEVASFVNQDVSPSLLSGEDGTILFQNRAAIERFGMRRGQLLSRTLADVFADPAAILVPLQRRADARGSAFEDRTTRRGHLRISVHKIEKKRFLWRLENMVERNPAARGADLISLPMLTVSSSGTILFMNEAMRRLTGNRAKTLEAVFRDLPLRSGEEHEIFGADGLVRSLVAEVEGMAGRREIYLLPVRGNLVSTHDATAFERLPVALLRLTTTGRVLEANRAARVLLGVLPDGVSLMDLLEGLGRPVADWLADAVNGRGENRPEVLRLRGAEQDTFLQVILSRVTEAAGSVLMATLSDATQLKTLEAQFVQSQKMQAIGQLAGGVAHDFNNLLTAISGHCDLLLLRHTPTDPDYADLTQIAQNANRAASLVGQLLAFSRKQTLRPAIIDLRDILSDLTHLLNRLVGEKVQLSLAHDPSLRPIRADKRQLEQVLMNLVVNARDAMADGGKIEISTENLTLQADQRLGRATLPAGNYVVVRVCDEGAGISAEILDKIFEPFFTTKRPGEGTGLGLSTAYGIIKQTGGYIFCESLIDVGTTFSLYFPAYDRPDAPLVQPPAATVRRVGPIGEGVVLLVEDEAPVRAFASRALKMRGYSVIEASNAEEALDVLKDTSLMVDVFVTDVIMPGMDGPSWVREALKDRPNTRVVFVSGYSEEGLAEERDRIPNSVFLPKPFSLGELTATVQNQLQ